MHCCTCATQQEPWGIPASADDQEPSPQRVHVGLFWGKLVGFWYKPILLLAWGGDGEHPEGGQMAPWAGQPSSWGPDLVLGFLAMQMEKGMSSFLQAM